MPPINEFSREVPIEPWPRGAHGLTCEASPSERRALADRFGLLELPALRGEGRLERLRGGDEILFEGRLEAEVVQACVVSLEPVRSTIRAPVRRRFVRDPGWATAPADHGSAEGGDDEVELLTGDRIDLGEVFAEELGLALPTYPHAAGATEMVLGRLGPEVSFCPAEADETAVAERATEVRRAIGEPARS